MSWIAKANFLMNKINYKILVYFYLLIMKVKQGWRLMVFNATFNNISVISWRFNQQRLGNHSGHERMVVGFTATYAISAYHH